MTKEEFIENCNNQGYACINVAKRWANNHPKEDYTEDDMLRCYRSTNGGDMGGDSGKWRCVMDRYGSSYKTTKKYKHGYDM